MELSLTSRGARALAALLAPAITFAAAAHNHLTVDTASGAFGDQIRIKAGYYPNESQFSVVNGRLDYAGSPAVYLLADRLQQAGPQADWFAADDILLTSDFYAATGRLNGGDFRWEIASVTTLAGAPAMMAWGTWDASMTTFSAEAISDASSRAGRSFDTFWADHNHDQAYAFSAAGTYDVTFVAWDGNGKFADSAPMSVRFEVVPAPGAMALLAVAGIGARRRRRASVAGSLAAIAVVSAAHAHVGYGGRDFGTLSATVSTISNQTVSSSFGWADATDADWGDSHRGRFFRFHVASDMSAGEAVSITVLRNSLGTGQQGTFLPGFSLYQGLGQLAPEQGGHDASQLSIDSRPAGTEGSLRALASWSIGNDATLDSQGNVLYAPRLAYFTYVGHAADGTSANFGDAPGICGDGNADGFVTAAFSGLAAGDYSLWVGGCNYAAQLTETGASFPTYGVTVSVQLVPAPGAMALLAVAGLAGRRRRAERV